MPVKKFIWSERCDQCGCAASERAGTDQVQGRRERPAGKFINTTAASGAALLEIGYYSAAFVAAAFVANVSTGRLCRSW